MIHLLPARVTVRVVAFSRALAEATVTLPDGRVRVVALAQLHATGGQRELLATLRAAEAATARLEQDRNP